MIGHYLLALTPEQEGRVLTLPINSYHGRPFVEGRCLVQCTEPHLSAMAALHFNCLGSNESVFTGPAHHYERLCARFGDERINAAIRNRILSNQARRALAGSREAVSA